jgi:hypothetical protein
MGYDLESRYAVYPLARDTAPLPIACALASGWPRFQVAAVAGHRRYAAVHIETAIGQF